MFPSPHFFKGDSETASKRLTEARDRGRLQRELKQLTKSATEYIELVLQRLGDHVTYANRDYMYACIDSSYHRSLSTGKR